MPEDQDHTNVRAWTPSDIHAEMGDTAEPFFVLLTDALAMAEVAFDGGQPTPDKDKQVLIVADAIESSFIDGYERGSAEESVEAKKSERSRIREGVRNHPLLSRCLLPFELTILLAIIDDRVQELADKEAREWQEYRERAHADPDSVDEGDWPSLGLCGWCGAPATGTAPNSVGLGTTACAEHAAPVPPAV